MHHLPVIGARFGTATNLLLFLSWRDNQAAPKTVFSALGGATFSFARGRASFKAA